MLQEKPFHKVISIFLVVILVFINTCYLSPSAEGNFNPGNFNPGDFNPGDFNPGDFNPGDFNPGDFNPGEFSPGDFNPGDFNPGDFNPGEFSPGDFNPGNFNPNDLSPKDFPEGNGSPNSQKGNNDKGKDKGSKEKDNGKPEYSFEQKLDHFIKDMIDGTGKIVKDGVDWTIEATTDLADKTVDIFNGATDLALEGIDKITTGITNTTEWFRYNGVKTFINISEFSETDFGSAIFATSPAGIGLKWGLQSVDTDRLTSANDLFHDRIKSFVNIKDSAFDALKKSNDSFFNKWKAHNNNIKNTIKNFYAKTDDFVRVAAKSRLDRLGSYFDFSPNSRPYGTIKEITIEDEQLMKFADLAYIKNNGQKYETSKRNYSNDVNELPVGFEENKKLSTSGISGLSAKTFIDEENKRVVLSFRGTEPGDDVKDFYADFALVFGIPNPQHTEAKELAKKVLEQYYGYEIVIVGHSLGGNVAQEVGRHYKIPTVTFNAPGMQMHKDAVDSYPDFIKKGLNPKDNANYSRFIDKHNENDKYNDLIINHISGKDEIGKLGVHIGRTIIYDRDESGKLIIYESDDYGPEQINEDKFWNKIPRTVQDVKGGTSHHGIHNFEEYLQDGSLRREEED